MIQIRIIRPLRLLCFLTALLLTGNMMGQESNELISKLQAEMYKYFSTPEQEKFLEITEQLKTECLKAGDEQLFYKAWGNQAIYAATHQHRNRATEIAKEMKEYAKEKDSRFGEYTALHVTGSVLLQMRNYEEAEATFLEAIEYLRSFFEGQSAAAEYLELVTISNRRNDIEKGKKYARMVLTEPGLQPQHKVRAYSMLCQYAYLEDKREEFNELYTQWIEATRETAPGSLKSTV